MTNVQQPWQRIDGQLCVALLFLLCAGIITLYSLSYIASAKFTLSHFYRHCMYVISAVLLFYAVLHVSLRTWSVYMPWILSVALILCLLTLLFPPAKGAARWISIFGFTVQVSEFLKFAALLVFATWGKLIIDNNTMRNITLGQVIRPMIPLAVFLFSAIVILIFKKDLGTIIVLSLTALVVLVLAGTPWRYTFAVAGALLVLAVLLVVFEPYRVTRMLAFLNPLADPYGSGYAQLQSLMAYSNGGWLGVGVGGSIKKELLPEVHNDFIIAVIAEEFGWLGFFAVCGVYLFIAMRAIGIGKKANARGELFGAFYACALAALLITQVTINIGGSLSVLPSKGITLPLVSYGGSSLWASAIMLAVLLRLHVENRINEEKQ